MTDLRNTPACTGLTSSGECARRVSWEYPRMYGVNAGYSLSAIVERGIPPHVRG